MLKLTESELETYAREFFNKSISSFGDMEDSVVGEFMKKVVEKHTVSVSIGSHSIMSGTFAVKIPQPGEYRGLLGANGQFVKQPQQQQRDLFTGNAVLREQANDAESRL